jgi:hypothetical protein
MLLKYGAEGNGNGKMVQRKNGAKVERLACNIQTNLPMIHKFSAA